jgi:CO/xanthine dehydrogenase Mo-binding subunit
MTIRLKMAADSNGIITAKDMEIVADNGATSGYGPAIVDTAATRVDSLYRFKNLRVSAKLAYTNKVTASAFRGFGNVKGHFAVETLMDILAHKLGMDPKEIRLRNATQVGDVTAHGWEINSCGLADTINKAASLARWAEKRQRKKKTHDGERFRGIGISCGLHVSGNRVVAPAGDGASAQVRIHEDGTVHVATSEGDIGQGANTVFAQIAAETLGIPYEDVYIDNLDTDVTYFGTGAVASRVTLIGGNAVKLGAVAAKERLIQAAAHKWDTNEKNVDLIRGRLVDLKNETEMEIREAATHYIGMTGGSRLMGEGFFRAEGVVIPDKEKYGNVSLAYAFATHIAEVEVDIGTGHIEVLGLWAVHDAGKVINPITAEGQVEGGLAQGIGYALLEEYRFEDGRLLNPNFTDYAIPTALDVPPMVVDWVETHEPNGPFGAKSIGEMAMVPTSPAIANAVFDAIGLRMTTLPMTPERVFSALKKEGLRVE